MSTIFSRFAKDKAASTAIDCGLIAAIVGVAITIGLTSLQPAIAGIFSVLTGGAPAG